MTMNRHQSKGFRAAWAVLVLGLCSVLQTGCNGPPPTLDEVMGTYRLASPAGPATLRLNADGTWEYDLAKDGGFRRTGNWEREPRPDLPSILVIGLNSFEFGFSRYSGDRMGGVYYLMNLEYYYPRPAIRACLGDSYDMCFIKQQ